MPRHGHQWWHVILNTRGSWLHGDPRGFRSRGHRIHSSGDYKHRPPQGEHAGLYAYHQQRAGGAVKLSSAEQSLIGERLVRKLATRGYRLLALSVDAHHAHLLAELPAQTNAETNVIAGTWKQAASHAVRETQPGRMWSAGGRPTVVRDEAHQRAVYRYILRHGEQGAWVWSFEDAG